MDYRERIVSDPDLLLGKPVVKGTRISVEHILKKVSEGAEKTDLIKMHPQLTESDLSAVFNYASEVIGNEKMIDLQ